MAWTNLKSTVAVGVCAVTAATTIVIESQQIAKLRTQNQRLLAEKQSVQTIRDDELARLRAENEDLERLRREMSDVHKLRAEVAQFRRDRTESAKLMEDNARLRQQIKQYASAKPSQAVEDVEAKKEAQEKQSLAKLDYLKVWTGAIQQYVLDNSTNVPANFDAAIPYMPPAIRDLFSHDEFEIVFNGSMNALANPERTIIIKEKEPMQTWDGKWTRAYGFADGHSEIHTESARDGFMNWEKARTATSVSNQ